MKKYINRLMVAALSMVMLVSVQGCNDYFDVGNNPNLVTNPNINNLLSTATHKTGTIARSYAGLSTYYNQNVASPGVASATDIYDITNQSGRWNSSYYAMADIYDMLVMAEEQEAYIHMGIGQLLMAYHLGLVIDNWDAAPYNEAFGKENTLTPSYQSSEELYGIITNLISDGLSNLNRTDSRVAMDSHLDLIHGGDVSAWIKTGYGLRARHLNKISKKSSYNPTAVLSALDNAYTSNADNMTMSTFNGRNPWAQIARDNLGSLLGGWLGEQFINHLNGTTYGVFDPRLPKITDETVHGTYVGTHNGRGNHGNEANTIWDECYISTNSPISGDDSPIFIMTYPELKFVEAEAALRASDPTRAYAAYLEGIRASMEQLEVEEDDRDAYLAEPSVSVGAGNLTLDHIFKEKYVATYLMFEGWNDARRYDYQYPGFKLPDNAVLSNFIRRVPVPEDELNRNGENTPAMVSLDTPLWWDRP